MLALLSKLWRATTVRQKTCVAATTLTATRCTPLRTMHWQVGQHFARIQIFYLGSFRNIHNQVGSTASVQVLTHAVYAIACPAVRVIAKCQQRRNVVVGHEPYRATVATVATVWSAKCNWPFTTETDATKTTVATANVELGFIDKCTHRGFLGY